MKSGLEGRNNETYIVPGPTFRSVSMKSGLEGRNNLPMRQTDGRGASLNEVRPRRPEQFCLDQRYCTSGEEVSMKSGLEGRNNELPEPGLADGLLVSMKSGLEGRNNVSTATSSTTRKECLNEVRPRRPEQSPAILRPGTRLGGVSMKSGLEGRNNGSPRKAALTRNFTSTCELSAPPDPIKPLC